MELQYSNISLHTRSDFRQKAMFIEYTRFVYSNCFLFFPKSLSFFSSRTRLVSEGGWGGETTSCLDDKRRNRSSHIPFVLCINRVLTSKKYYNNSVTLLLVLLYTHTHTHTQSLGKIVGIQHTTCVPLCCIVWAWIT